jgi:hypothetical protein
MAFPADSKGRNDIARRRASAYPVLAISDSRSGAYMRLGVSTRR